MKYIRQFIEYVLSPLKSLLWDEANKSLSSSRFVMVVGVSMNAAVVIWFITEVHYLVISHAGFPDALPNFTWLFGMSSAVAGIGVGSYAVNKLTSKPPDADAQ